MKLNFFLITLLISSRLFSQNMNEAGHFFSYDPDTMRFEKTKSGDNYVLEYKGIRFAGNTGFTTAAGFVTITGGDASSTLRLFNHQGTEFFSHAFSKTINFTLSPSETFCAFYDGKEIQVLNLSTKSIQSYPGSIVFAVNDLGELAYYSEENSSVTYKKKTIKVSGPVYKILCFDNEMLFLGRTELLSFRKDTLQNIWNAPEGRLFDAVVSNEKLFISTKTEQPAEFIFKSYSSNVHFRFLPEEERHYILQNTPAPKQVKKKSSPNAVAAAGEFFRDPLNYLSDTVYQPVGNSYDEIQLYSGTPVYLHPGVDLLGVHLQNVYSVKDGYVKAILTTGGTYYWRAAIADQNIFTLTKGYLYAHLDQTTIPYMAGDFVMETNVIGQLVDFPVTGFVHCHFARIQDIGVTWAGDWQTIDNPLLYMSNLRDTIPPTFENTINSDVFAFRDSSGNYLAANDLQGKVQVISKVYDRVNSAWHVDVNHLHYSLSPLAHPATMLIDTLAFDYHYYNDYYAAGPYYSCLERTVYSNDVTCHSAGDYTLRDFYHIVTNTDGNDTITGNDSLQFFNTMNFANGDYIFRVTATDASGNTSKDSMVIEIHNGDFIEENNEFKNITIQPNPTTGKVNIRFYSKEISSAISIGIKNELGSAIAVPYSAETNSDQKSFEFDLRRLPNGVYFLNIQGKDQNLIRKIVKQD